MAVDTPNPIDSDDVLQAAQEVDARALARQLSISLEAAELYLQSDVIDLHIDSFIWHRVFGYDLTKRHGPGLFNGCFYSQVDLPRVLEARLNGAVWIITTNPLRDSPDRAEVFVENYRALRELFARTSNAFQIAADFGGYQAARQAGKHAAFIGIQGGNALDIDENALDLIADNAVILVTLMHLYPSKLGDTSTPLLRSKRRGLSAFGLEYVRQLNARRIFVDLAHVSRPGFWDAVRVHDKSLPFIVSHTALAAVHDHWRNLDDEQLRAVADSGGIAGVLFHSEFLGDPLFRGQVSSVVRHLEHIVHSVGAQHAALGSDWDGSICTPRDMRTCLELPRLVQIMLDRKWRIDDVRWVLGQSFLRALRQLRP